VQGKKGKQNRLHVQEKKSPPMTRARKKGNQNRLQVQEKKSKNRLTRISSQGNRANQPRANPLIE
jgi:hypothetical protein